ncbi:MAG: SH3 domain-containing protein [bacterium]
MAVASPPNPPAATSSKSAASARWVNSVARGWVIVRAGPSKESRLVASIGPNTRVQLGESRGTWRRIKARNISGWVEPSTLFAAIPTTARARVLVSR